MPHQTVTNHLQVVLFAIADKLIGYAEVEETFCRSQRLGLHTVLGDSTVEVLVHNSIGLRHLTVALPLVDGSTNQEVLTEGILQTLLSH